MTNSKHDQASSSTGEMTDSEPGQPKNPTDSAIEMLADDSGTASNPPSDGTELTMATLLQQLAEAENKALRYQADLENYRRRAKRELDDQLRYSNWSLASDLLDALDNLHRAVETAQADADAANLLVGVRMVFTQLEEILSKHGIRRIQSEGQAFDPNCHQAIQIVTTSEAADNCVVQELRPGYKLHDRIIRPSQVIVSRHP